MSIDTDYAVLRKVLADHDPQGWAIEFGVHSGYSLAIIADKMPVLGLDSFEGLPEDWREGFPKGAFAPLSRTFDGDPHLPHVPNAMIVPGLFSDTLPVLTARGLPQLGLIHIDCDLYSSTVTALEGVKDYMFPGTVIVFDEYHGYDGHEEHERKAWNEFADKYGASYHTLAMGEQERAIQLTGPLL